MQVIELRHALNKVWLSSSSRSLNSIDKQLSEHLAAVAGKLLDFSTRVYRTATGDSFIVLLID